MKKSHKEKVETLFKTVITDTSFVKIPILRKQKEAKTLEQKAEEAANLIIKIRKRRLKLVTGEYAVFPEGVALRTALEELDKTEKEYIALFTGKIFTERYTCSYFVIPSGSDEKIVITRFSLQKGMLPLESIDGKEITIEFKAFVPRIQGITPGGENNKNLLYYRIPSTCAVKINEAERLLFDGRVSIFQAGTLLSLPVPER